jgi:16S rRNA (adenine1518-N6/adenine1519-N6)-dimethyltransferase
MPEEIPFLPDPRFVRPEPPPPPPPPVEPVFTGPSPRQTLGFLRSLLQAHGLEPKSKLGQNYLIDLNLIDLIVRTAEISPSDAILEVGTGTGTLTGKLAEAAGQVVTVEIDKTFQPIAQQVVGRRTNVHYLLGDCLAKKSELNPEMLTAWDHAAKQPGITQRKLVANLPYVIATPLISNLLVDGPQIERMVVMVQWEIAERLRAEVGTKDYNALSVLVQSVADVQTIRKVPPSSFHPRPKVESAITEIRPNPEKRNIVGNVAQFRDFLRSLYVHRRKNLRQALVGFPSGRKEKEFVDSTLRMLEIDGGRRAESLSIEDHLRLCRAFTSES